MNDSFEVHHRSASSFLYSSSWVAILACSLVKRNSLLSSLVGTQRIAIWFPFFRNFLITLYIRQT